MSSPVSDQVVVLNPPQSMDTVDLLLDDAWVALATAIDQVVQATSTAILVHILGYRDDVREVWVRMDTSHEPAHGHLDALFTADGLNILPDVAEEPWLMEVEEFAWDLGNIAGSRFVRGDDGTRRLKITAAAR